MASKQVTLAIFKDEASADQAAESLERWDGASDDIKLKSIGVLVLRVTEPDRPRPFKVPFVWPVALLSTAACLFIMVGLPKQAWERFLLWLGLGILIYVFYGYRHSRLRGAGS